MSVLYSLVINSILSAIVLIGYFQLSQTEYIIKIPTTTTTTIRPYIRTSGLSLPLRNVHPPKCWREVPAVFFQYEKDIPIIGNSTTNPYFNLIEVCCKGYKRYEYDWSKCVPDCGNKCQANGFCINGGICKCFNEFILNNHNACIPTCPLGCPHGQCYLNGTCICNRGYELDPTMKFCIPKCELECGHNELCVAPERCECAEGFGRSLMPDNRMGCQPLCIPDCGFGRCIGPNECECFHGYEKRMNGTACESNCYMRCENGFCVNRTTCLCHNGYKYDFNTTSCLPDCDDNCENGICLSPGNCRCFNGYERDGAKCKAICTDSCGFYGKCIAPNACGCATVDGPYKTYQQCKDGTCTPRGRCICEQGKTRFINRCMSSDEVTTYAVTHAIPLNTTFVEEFNLLIGRHFNFTWNKYHWMYK